MTTAHRFVDLQYVHILFVFSVFSLFIAFIVFIIFSVVFAGQNLFVIIPPMLRCYSWQSPLCRHGQGDQDKDKDIDDDDYHLNEDCEHNNDDNDDGNDDGNEDDNDDGNDDGNDDDNNDGWSHRGEDDSANCEDQDDDDDGGNDIDNEDFRVMNVMSSIRMKMMIVNMMPRMMATTISNCQVCMYP